MEKTSNVSGLSAKLKQKMEEDSSQQRALILSEQEKLLSSLQSTYRNALATTMSDIQSSLQTSIKSASSLTQTEIQSLQTALTATLQQHQEALMESLSNSFSKATESLLSKMEPAEDSLSNLSSSLNDIAQSLNDTKVSLTGITKAADQSAKVIKKRWIISAAASLSLLLIICTGSWGLMRYLSNQVQRNLALIEQQKQTIQSLNNQTLGVQIIEAPNGTFLILPTNAQDGYTLGGKSAIKLPTN